MSFFREFIQKNMKTAGGFVQKDMKIAGHSNAVNLSTVAAVINLNPMMPNHDGCKLNSANAIL